jgi:hypothetical protein
LFTVVLLKRAGCPRKPALYGGFSSRQSTNPSKIRPRGGAARAIVG